MNVDCTRVGSRDTSRHTWLACPDYLFIKVRTKFGLITQTGGGRERRKREKEEAKGNGRERKKEEKRREKERVR